MSDSMPNTVNPTLATSLADLSIGPGKVMQANPISQHSDLSPSLPLNKTETNHIKESLPTYNGSQLPPSSLGASHLPPQKLNSYSPSLVPKSEHNFPVTSSGSSLINNHHSTLSDTNHVSTSEKLAAPEVAHSNSFPSTNVNGNLSLDSALSKSGPSARLEVNPQISTLSSPNTSVSNLVSSANSLSSNVASSPSHMAPGSPYSSLLSANTNSSMQIGSSPCPLTPTAATLGTVSPMASGSTMPISQAPTLSSPQGAPIGFGNLSPGPNFSQPGPRMGLPPNMASPSSIPSSMPLRPPMGPPGLNMTSSGPSMGLPGPSMAPIGAGMTPLGPGMVLPGPGMVPPGPGMVPPGPGMAPPGPGMAPPGPGMAPPGPGMAPPGPGMAPPGPGMAPPGPGMAPPRLGMAPSPGMAPPGPNTIPPYMPNAPLSNMNSPSFNSSLPTPMSNAGMQLHRMPRPHNAGMPPMPAPSMASPGGPIPQPPSSFGMSPLSPSSSAPPPSLTSFSPGMPPLQSSPMTSGMPNATGTSYPPNMTPMGSPMSQGNASMPPPPNASMPPPPQSMHSGMQTRYPGSGAPTNQMSNYPSQGRRLNPDDMPSPLQVVEEDQEARSGEFITNLKGAPPPLVTTDFFVRDGGNVSPHFMRSTMYSVPALPDMMKQCSVPFGLVISPLAEKHPEEQPIYTGTSLANGPVRCNRCKAYMSPLMLFMDGGRRFQCLLCKQVNEVPADYFCHMDGQGARADKYHRAELCLGTYEYIATAEYCKEKTLPKEPAFIFVIEITQLMMQRGIVNLLCQNMRSILKDLPMEETQEENPKSKVHVGFITYDSNVHFYKMNGLAPEMCIVCDKNDMFVPVPDGVLCDIDKVSDNLDKLMNSIPQNFNSTRETSGALSGAIQAGMAALKASGRAGKLFIFHSSLPQVSDDGKLKNREERKLLATEKEKSILSPQNTHYNNLAQDLVNVGCGVDMYLFNDAYVDLATIGQVCRLTGGQCYKYSMFQLNKDGPRLLEDLKLNLKQNIAFDAMMRVRTSTGVRPVDFFGHFYMTNTQDIELAIVDARKAITIEIKHDDKLTEEDGVYIQAALLYTSVSGQRKLRIMNLALNVCTLMADLYKNCDLDTMMNFFSKQSMFKFLDVTAKQVKENLIAKTAQILACYRRNCATPSSAGQLILPELMKLLPLYVNCLSKCDALSGGQDMTCDDRSWHIYQLSTMSVSASVVYLYPRLIPLSEESDKEGKIPAPVRTSYEKLRPDSVFLLENGLFMFMWVGSGTPSTWMNDVFGVTAPHQLDPVLAELPELDNPTSKRVRSIIDAIRSQRRQHLRLFVVPQQGKHELVMRNYLIEDKGVYSSPSYVDFLCHVHKEIRNLLS